MRSFSWDTYGPTLGAPEDTGVVAVVDGCASRQLHQRSRPSLVLTANPRHLRLLCSASLLVTPFRTQNVPPPMSSTKLVTPLAARPVQPPIHVAFAPASAGEGETFALLFGREVHVRQVVSKLDRSQPGRIQTYTEPSILPLGTTVSPRQVAVGAAEGGQGSVVVLGWDTDAQSDALWFATYGGEKAAWEYIPLPSTGRGSISATLGGFVFQTKEGDMLFCASRPPNLSRLDPSVLRS